MQVSSLAPECIIRGLSPKTSMSFVMNCRFSFTLSYLLDFQLEFSFQIPKSSYGDQFYGLLLNGGNLFCVLMWVYKVSGNGCRDYTTEFVPTIGSGYCLICVGVEI